MASLADLFNPTILIFLGILVLVVALLVVYFESKMREQNHKIASMLSLVSTLAEDMNGVKMGLNHLAIRGGASFISENGPKYTPEENLGNKQLSLIEVSDEEEDYDEDDILGDDNTSESDESNEDTKVIKLQVSNEIIDDDETYEEANNSDFEPEEDLEGFELDEDTFDIKVDNDYVEDVLDLKYEDLKDKTEEEIKVDNLEELKIPSSNDLKTISINLGEEHSYHEENIDYKKLQLPKLRSIAIEKGLTNNSEASKLKKPELLKLLGAE